MVGGARGKAFLSLAVSEGYNAIAAGEELVDHLASVILWFVILYFFDLDIRCFNV